jgi:hypothetical protein
METAKKIPTGTGEVRDTRQGPTEGGRCQCRKIRRETSGIPREAWDPNSKEERNNWNLKGSSGSKLKRRRQITGLLRELKPWRLQRRCRPALKM